jgi:hypothetical protein
MVGLPAGACFAVRVSEVLEHHFTVLSMRLLRCCGGEKPSYACQLLKVFSVSVVLICNSIAGKSGRVVRGSEQRISCASVGYLLVSQLLWWLCWCRRWICGVSTHEWEFSNDVIALRRGGSWTLWRNCEPLRFALDRRHSRTIWKCYEETTDLTRALLKIASILQGFRILRVRGCTSICTPHTVCTPKLA